MTEVEQKHTEALRRLGMTGRVRAAFGLWDFAQRVATTSVRQRHPEWTEAQVAAAVRERVLGRSDLR